MFQIRQFTQMTMDLLCVFAQTLYKLCSAECTRVMKLLS